MGWACEMLALTEGGGHVEGRTQGPLIEGGVIQMLTLADRGGHPNADIC